MDAEAVRIGSLQRALFHRYGLDVRSHWLQLEEPRIRVHVLDVGRGPPVVLVHGGGGSASVWAPLMAELHGLRQIAVDRPGCGLTDPCDYTGVDVRRHGVAFLQSTLDAVGIPTATFVANSMGGLWAFWLAIDRPERVQGIAQLGCPAFLLETSTPLEMRLAAVRAAAGLPPPPPSPSRKILDRLVGEGAVDRLPSELIESIHVAESALSHRTMRHSLLRAVLGRAGASPGLLFGEEDVRRITQPVAFVWGDGDAYGPPSVGRRACGMMADATLDVLRAGHLPWLDDPVRCAAAVRRLVDRSGSR